MNYIFIFTIGVVAATLGSMVGATSVISIPLLIVSGLPPHVAAATTKLGQLGMVVVSAIKFARAGKIQWKHVLKFCVIALVGSYIGSNLLLQIDERLLEYFIVAIMFVIVPLLFLKKNIGLEHKETSKKMKGIGYILYFFCLIWAGFIGAGAGTVIFFIFMSLFGFTMIESTATHKVPTLIMTLTALAVFAGHGIINYKAGVVLLIGMAVGGYIGTHLAIKKGNKWVKTIFAIVAILSALKILF